MPTSSSFARRWRKCVRWREQFLPALKRGAIVTDVGSVKAGVVRELESLVKKAGAHFVGSHPMAGGEKMGVRGRARESV